MTSREIVIQIEETYRDLVDTKAAMMSLVNKHRDVFAEFGDLADTYNAARTTHLNILKQHKMASPMFRMSIPKTFVCDEIETAKEILKDRFPEFFETVYKPKTAPIRNALDAETIPGLEMVVKEIEQTPRHTGPKEVEISVLRGRD